MQVKFTAGYASADLVPERAKLAISLLTALYYENREAFSTVVGGNSVVLPFGLQSLIQSLKVGTYV